MRLDESSDENIYRFDGFLVDAQNFRVERNGDAIVLTPRAFDVLLSLLKHRGNVVEKRQLFEEVWKDTFVTDNALTKVVKELRHSLDDSAEHPLYIETIPKRGYRFIGGLADDELLPATEQRHVSRSRPLLATSSRIAILCVLVAIVTAGGVWVAYKDPSSSPKTIAVLPFKPLNSGSRDESLEMGMAETLITRLSSLRNVVVRPMRSVRKFTDASEDPLRAGNELQTDVVLDGSIQKADDRIRVTVRMIDVQSGSTLWSEQFDESFTDIFRVQDSIANRIAGVLALRLSRQEQEQLAKHMTESPAAYENYLRGQFLWHRRGPDWIKLSLDAYTLALAEDPDFALAHIGVAESYIMLSGHRRITMQEAEAKAGPSIARALEIDNSLAQAHNALAELKYQYQYDWRGAETEFKTAIDLNPNIAWIRQAYGWFMMSEGRFDEAAVEMDKARQLDPSSLTLAVARGRLYYYSRQYDQAIEHFHNLIVLEPNEESSYKSLIGTYIQKGMHAEAFEMYLRAKSLSNAPPEDMAKSRETFAVGGWQALHRKSISELDEASARSRQVSPSSYAVLYTRLGEKDKAFEWLEKVFDARDVAILQFNIDPANDILRDDPRYAALLERIGLKP